MSSDPKECRANAERYTSVAEEDSTRLAQTWASLLERAQALKADARKA